MSTQQSSPAASATPSRDVSLASSQASLPSPPPLPEFNSATPPGITHSISDFQLSSTSMDSLGVKDMNLTNGNKVVQLRGASTQPDDSGGDDMDDVPFQSISISEDVPPTHSVSSHGIMRNSTPDGDKGHKKSDSFSRRASSAISSMTHTRTNSGGGTRDHFRNKSVSGPIAGGISRDRTPPPQSFTANQLQVNNSTNNSSAASSSSSLPTQAQNGSTHKLKSKAGPSALERVLSKTRPAHLPPKSREEDTAHLKTWQDMMEQSRALERQRKEALAHQAAVRKEKLLANMPIWMDEIVENPRKALKGDSSAPNNKNPATGGGRRGSSTATAGASTAAKYRELWWEGVPPQLRAGVWENIVGNPLGMSKNAYSNHVTRFQELKQNAKFPKSILDQIETDADAAYPSLKLFKKEGGVLFEGLVDLLGAWMMTRLPKSLPYISEISLVAATFLLNMPADAAFKTMLNFIDNSMLLKYFVDPRKKDEQNAYWRIFNTLCADALPKVQYNLVTHGVRIPQSWFLTLFVQQLQFETVCRVWDQILLDGDSAIFRTCIAILRILEQKLYFPDKIELDAVLSGNVSQQLRKPSTTVQTLHEMHMENKITVSLSNDGGNILSINENEDEIGITGGGGWFGIEEDKLFSVMRAEGWKESAFDRLVQRELDSI